MYETFTALYASCAVKNASSASLPLLEVSFPLLSIFGESKHLNDLAQAASGAAGSWWP